MPTREITAAGVGNPLIRLPLPVPPMLEETLGYKGDERYIALAYYCQELQLSSRSASWGGAAVGWAGFGEYLRHPLVMAVRRTYDIYGDDLAGIPEHGFVLDRLERVLFIGDLRSTQAFIRGPVRVPSEPVTLSEKELKQIQGTLRAWCEGHRPTGEELHDALIQESQLLWEMTTWIRETLDPLWEEVLAEIALRNEKG